MTDHYAVVGNPVGHSKSPQIHTLFAEQTHQDIEYSTLLSPLDAFRETVMKFFKQEKDNEGKGLNVTVPFKQEAWELCNEPCNELSDYAKLAGAVNTLVRRDDGSIYGTNTDGVGLVTDLEENNQVILSGKKILILGAGGAVRGVLQPILEKQPAQLFIANRTESKAHQLAALFKPSDKIAAGGFGSVNDMNFDIIINATAASLSGDVPPVSKKCIQHASCCYDMMYSNKPTAFVQWTKELGVPKSLDGLGMLIEQAAESFNIWRGVRPTTQSVFRHMGR
ncbi:MAG: shikimate dehydrogenase [Thiotrichaceae bacterium]